MKKGIVCMGFLLAACSTPCPDTVAFSAVEQEKTIASLMEEQQEAWNQHSLEGFMQAYWKSDSLTFIGSRGITYGWQTTLENYRKSYGNAELMGTLQFDNDRIEILQDSSAMVTGRWNLFRSADSLSGSYLLVWKRINGEWKIIADHSS